jgi:hypothetical protein
MTSLTDPKRAESWLADMDGVLVHEERALRGRVANSIAEVMELVGAPAEATA